MSGEAQVRRHRAPRSEVARRLAEAGSRIGVGALVLAALAVGGVIRSYTPDTDRRERPYVRTGDQGERIDARTFHGTVLDVRGATKVTRTRRTYESAGVWVVVRVRVVATAAPVLLNHAALRDNRGRDYVPTGRFNQPLTDGRTLQPGLAAEGEIVFEVPRTAASGLALRLSTGRVGQRMEALAEIDLRIDSAKAAAWSATSDPVTVEDAKAAAG